MLEFAAAIRRAIEMSAATRQMHLGVFVLGTGNHSAGWRYEGAATSNNQLPGIQADRWVRAFAGTTLTERYAKWLTIRIS
jgi:hypothetical protein